MSQRLLPFLLPLLFAPQVLAAAPQGAVVLQADAAWLGGGERISPAFVLVQDGEVKAVGTRPPMSRAQRVELHGTLAVGLVDAWGGPVPADLLATRHRPGGLDLADSLPAGLDGADPALAARVRAARRSGVAAAYLGPGGAAVRRGVGATVVFDAHDLPVAAGEPMLDLAAGSALGNALDAQLRGRELVALFEGGDAFRDLQDEYADKLEKYEKDLEDYRKKLEEFKKKKEEAEKAAARGEGNGKEEKKPEPPKRPQRPDPPVADGGMDQVLRALAGSLMVRVEANSVGDLRELIALKERFALDLVVVGGQDADLVAEELAAADIPVVLPALAPHGGDPERALAHRFRTLSEAGVDVALASGGGDGTQGLLLLRAGELVAAGNDAAAVWDALTVTPARLLGLEGERGRLAAGAAADLILFEGSSPFDASAPMRVHTAQGGFDQ